MVHELSWKVHCSSVGPGIEILQGAFGKQTV